MAGPTSFAGKTPALVDRASRRMAAVVMKDLVGPA
jgi:hypothetical protein